MKLFNALNRLINRGITYEEHFLTTNRLGMEEYDESSGAAQTESGTMGNCNIAAETEGAEPAKDMCKRAGFTAAKSEAAQGTDLPVDCGCVAVCAVCGSAVYGKIFLSKLKRGNACKRGCAGAGGIVCFFGKSE